MRTSIKELNTFGIDVTASKVVYIDSIEQLERFFAENSSKWMVVGEGSNILFTRDYDGVILKLNICNVEIIENSGDRVVVRAEGGLNWDKFCGFCADNGLWGAENLSAIPGTVGAAPVQNIGAYGSEACDIITKVIYFDINDRSIKTIANSECQFGYRDSIFKRDYRGTVVIVAVEFELTRLGSAKLDYGALKSIVEEGKAASLDDIRRGVRQIRDSKLPNPREIGNGGSFFKNPVVTSEKYNSLLSSYPDMPSYKSGDMYKIPAAYLIDRAGWKGYRDGDVGVHRNQALVLVNYGKGTGSEVYALSERIIADIKSKFGIELSREINVI